MPSFRPAWIILALCLSSSTDLLTAEEARRVTFYGYDDCLRIENERTRVTICPAAGGRVLEYALDGKNALYLPPGDEGWTLESGKDGGRMTAGRFDIGPEQTIPAHPKLWSGRWSARITGPRSVRLTSAEDRNTGVQLIRDFALDEKASRLLCRQTIKNVSNRTVEYCHWSRTFALGDGICVIPLSKPSRFPHGYVMYGPGPAINYRPDDPHIQRRDGFLEITAAPQFPKLGMDSSDGWFAYVMKSDVMFVKRFSTYPDRPYNEVAGLTMSIWYPDGPMCELEPIGPRERLTPGQSAGFTETWWLLPRDYPDGQTPLDLKDVATQVQRDAPAAMHAVSGTVTLDGKTVTDATVTFQIVGASRVAVGRTNRRGQFRLTTFTPYDGATAGVNTVTVGGDVPDVYTDLETTPLRVTVSADRRNHFDLVLSAE